MSYIKIIPTLTTTNASDLAPKYSHLGADELFITFSGSSDEDVALCKSICRQVDVPVNVTAPATKLDDVKHFLYAGAAKFVFGEDVNPSFANEMKERFKKKIVVNKAEVYEEVTAETTDTVEIIAGKIAGSTKTAILITSTSTLDLMALKSICKSKGIDVNTFESAVTFDQFKLNSDGMIPCIVQDYKTDEVLMMAYMNEEAFEKTMATGIMTYYSRSRSELWVKGETSGHYQYVKSMAIDCDKDTLLAKVYQVGAACHTGNRSCFYTELAAKDVAGANPLKVFTEEYDIIADRKKEPKAGSYTNYLFDAGVDKILKKIGEEATEIVIAAKNPDAEEIKYEIADFMYHMMVLMVEKGVTWDDITKEFADRR